MTSSDEFKFAHQHAQINATAIFSPTDYDNAGVGFDTSNFKTRNGRTQAQNDCAVAVAKDTVPDLAKNQKWSKDDIARITAALDNGFPAIMNMPPGNGRDPCHNVDAEAARILQVILHLTPPVSVPALDDIKQAVRDAIKNPSVKPKPCNKGKARYLRSADCGCDDDHSDAPPAPIDKGRRHSRSQRQERARRPGRQHYIARGTQMSYLDRNVENDKAATASVQKLVITDVLDASLDLSSLNLGIITLADQVVEIPAGQSSFTTDLDLRPKKNLIVHIVAGLQNGNTLTWTCTALDPATMQPTTDPVLGFLDPDVAPPQGQGTFLYTINQKPNLAIGTVINNKATIVFDSNSPIDTPTLGAGNTVSLLDVDTDGHDGFPDELEIDARQAIRRIPTARRWAGAPFTLQTLDSLRKLHG